MTKVQEYAERMKELLEDALIEGIAIQPYAERNIDTNQVVEAGIVVLDRKESIEIPTYRNDSVLQLKS